MRALALWKPLQELERVMPLRPHIGDGIDGELESTAPSLVNAIEQFRPKISGNAAFRVLKKQSG